VLKNKKIQRLIKLWSKDFDPTNIIRIDKKYVHKTNEQNVFVSRIDCVEKGDKDTFIIQVAVDSTHPYFFEHCYDHVPGMLLLESGRQAATAIAHLFYTVNFDAVFILMEMYARFYNYVETSKPLFISSTVKNKKYKKGELIQMEQDGVFVQDFNEVGYMGGSWRMCNKRVIERMRQYAKPFSGEELR
jgi:hypothetical protein